MRKSTLSIRDLAKAIGLSKATVANALKGSPSVAAGTRRKVCAAAAKLGYERNPMVGAFMSALRRSQRADFQGVLAAVEVLEPFRAKHGGFHRRLIQACQDCAAEHGFKIEFFEVSPTGTSAKRLNTILKARGIRGLILLPTWRPMDFTLFDWSYLTGIYTDYITDKPVQNTVCGDHYRSTFELLLELRRRGYTRPGIILEAERDERIHYRTTAALRSYQALHPATPPVPPLVAPNIGPELFARWLERERPDVVLSHNTDMIEWIRASGLRVPADVGYVALNLAMAKCPCAALDLHPDQIGRSAVENLIAQIQRQAWGLPRFPTTTTITGAFVEGPTLAQSSVTRPGARTR